MHRFVKRGRVRDSHTVIYQIIISYSKSYLAYFLKNQYVQLLNYESHIFFVDAQLYLLSHMLSFSKT